MNLNPPRDRRFPARVIYGCSVNIAGQSGEEVRDKPVKR
jgi:hypothetical protein